MFFLSSIHSELVALRWILISSLTLFHTTQGLENGFSLMATKTTYENVLRENFPTGDTLKGSYHGEPWKKLCHPIHYSLTARHGNRYPSKSNFRVMQQFVDEIRDKVNEKYDFIRKWELPYSLDQVKLLTRTGWTDMEEMGKRMGWRWHLIYHEEMEDRKDEDDYDEHKRYNLDVKFVSSDIQRSLESARAFIKGFKTALHRPKDEKIPITTDNRLMRYFDECERYVHMVDQNKTALYEYYKYTSGPEMAAIAEKLKKKLGLEKYETMLDEETKNIVWHIFVTCGAETTLNGEKSKWCDLLDDDDGLILEYRSDIKHYWKNAYGYPINSFQSCLLSKDIFYHLDLAVIGRSMKREYHRGVFRFGHAETLYPLYAAMGLFNVSDPIKAHNFDQMKNRAFRGSRINPFSANIAFVLYDCDNSRDAMDLHRFTDKDLQSLPEHFEKFMIQVLLNEKPVTLPVCEHELCPYSLVKRHYRHLVDLCNFEEMCRMPKPPKENENIFKDEL
ncbi:multiple inositol polyphosphate phosphatase 1-like [Lineus longissimus]|uniref:multiple inositol polyphosphate phosphatase 1-like n=1 Tax=Lineus longissimus TaxID=88925 RepID=UPI002B4DC502